MHLTGKIDGYFSEINCFASVIAEAASDTTVPNVFVLNKILLIRVFNKFLIP
jgi:hypothetical protein